MKKMIWGIAALFTLCTSIATAQQPGAHMGVSVAFVYISGGGSAGTGFSGGYAFNEIAGIDLEYLRKFGDINGNLLSGFLALTTTGNTYLKGKIGATSASGDSFDGSSGSLA